MPCKLPTRPQVLFLCRPHRHPINTPSRWQRHLTPWLRTPTPYSHHRRFSLSSIPTVLLPPVVFTGLLITLWTYKCLMMMIFQNKIIYMPSMPPFSRSEKLEDYANLCKPVIWTEHSLRSGDGTALKLLEGAMPPKDNEGEPRQHVVIVYFQGNASSLPPRLPYLSNILRLLEPLNRAKDVQYTLVALSYRGFWKSKGSANQQGIELDAQAALQWVTDRYATIPNTKVVLWGQSIGAGVATTALATWLDSDSNPSQSINHMRVAGLLLETPFTSLKAMLIELYPQKFLPYRYLGPFLISNWDSVDALSRIGGALAQRDKRAIENVDDGGGDYEAGSNLQVLLLEAENDELVPKEDAKTLYELCQGYPNLKTQHKVVAGALHTDVMKKNEGKREIVRFLKGFEEAK